MKQTIGIKAYRQGEFPAGTKDGGYLLQIINAESGAVMGQLRVAADEKVTINGQQWTGGTLDVELPPGRYFPRAVSVDDQGNELPNASVVGEEVVILAPVVIMLPDAVEMNLDG